MKNIAIYSFLLFTLFFLSCNRSPEITRTDTPTSGNAFIACDDCLKPIIDEELAVFTGLNTDAHITPVYTSEAEIFKFILSDSIRLIFTARDITAAEKEQIKKLKRTPRSQKIAIDGIALIINKQNTDSLISIAALQKIMTGEVTDWNSISNLKQNKERPITVVFDNQGSSTIRFVEDSICKRKTISKNLTAANSNLEVIKYVETHSNALGIIGVNWVSNPKDTNKLTFLESIRVMSVSRENIPTIDNSYQPVPYYLTTGDYPLIRDIYAIISDVRGGLPAGFVSFVAGDSGQRIIVKAGLVPATRPTRLINIQNEF